MVYTWGVGKEYYVVEYYRTDRGDCPIEEFLESLIEKHRAKIEKFIEMLEEYGPDLPRPYADVLDGPVRELRIKFGNLQYRILYAFRGKIVLLTHGFVKKTWAVNQREIDRAKKYLSDWISRNS
jgi:hypothetical protein